MDKELTVFAAINPLGASHWTLIRARLFGEKHITEDSGVHVTIYKYKNKFYVTDCRKTA